MLDYLSQYGKRTATSKPSRQQLLLLIAVWGTLGLLYGGITVERFVSGRPQGSLGLAIGWVLIAAVNVAFRVVMLIQGNYEDAERER